MSEFAPARSTFTTVCWPAKLRTRTEVSLSAAARKVPFHRPHWVPDSQVPPERASVGKPVLKTAGMAPGTFGLVIGVLWS